MASSAGTTRGGGVLRDHRSELIAAVRFESGANGTRYMTAHLIQPYQRRSVPSVEEEVLMDYGRADNNLKLLAQFGIAAPFNAFDTVTVQMTPATSATAAVRGVFPCFCSTTCLLFRPSGEVSDPACYAT
jgi:hypothetical protein